MGELKKFYKDKKILVTGGVGSIGSEIVRKVLKFDPKTVRVIDNNETELFELGIELNDDRLRMLMGDVRDYKRLKFAMEDIDIVFHAAALKHVPLCEYNPFEAVRTNVLGTQNMIDVAIEHDVEKLILVSTDKAVNATNVMGATKLLAERMVTATNAFVGHKRIVLSSVRFGNVLDTRGSIVPLFRKQIKNGGPVTVTDPNMTRFMMSISNAVDLILKAAEMAKGGEIFILKMPAVRIGDLVEVMKEMLAPRYGHDSHKIQTKIIGKRPGEKTYEDLITKDEAENICEKEEMFVILPESSGEGVCKVDLKRTYTSNNVKLLTKEEIKDMLSGIC